MIGLCLPRTLGRRNIRSWEVTFSFYLSHVQFSPQIGDIGIGRRLALPVAGHAADGEGGGGRLLQLRLELPRLLEKKITH